MADGEWMRGFGFDRSQVDDALDRLEQGYPMTDGDLATVRSALEQLREERDAALAERDRMRRWAGRAEVAEGKLEAAEAEVRRYREGLREIAEDKTPAFRTMLGWADRWERHEAHARALLAGSEAEPDGEAQ